MSTTPEGGTAGAEQIADQVRRVAKLRRQRAEMNTKIEEARAAFFESIKHLTKEAEQLGSECASAEAMLRASTLAHYEQTKEARPAAGVQVKIFTHLEYDREKADKWTRETGLARIPERLDETAFKAIAKALIDKSTPIDFVVVKQEPKVTIATDLEKVLGTSSVEDNNPAVRPR
jgi:hypothetical protein